MANAWNKPHNCTNCGKSHTKPQALCGKCYYDKHRVKSEKTLRREAGLCSRCGINERTDGSYCSTCDRELNRTAFGINANTRRQSVNKSAARHGITDQISSTDIRELFESTTECRYCGDTLDNTCQVDHVTPLSRGGTNTKDNLELICRSCNVMKNDLTPDEYIAKSKKIASRH